MELIVTTHSFPFGNGETFFENELPYLCSSFDKVILVPENQMGQARKVPLNCEVRIIKLHNQLPLKKAVIKYGIKVCQHLLNCWLFDKSIEGKIYYAVKKWKIRWLDLLGEHFNGEQLVDNLPELKNEHTVLYHYWMINFARYLSWMKQSNIITNKQVCRIHGYDFNPKRHPKNHFPFRKAELKGYDKICAVSKFGLNLIQQLYPEQKHKTGLNRLGVHIPLLAEILKEVNNNQTMCFVSCSSVVAEKRVDWIAESMIEVAKNNQKTNFDWHHFGDGDKMKELKVLVENNEVDNLNISLHGATANADVLHFYKTNQVNAFIHASATEGGCPVAIQEAFAYAIPLAGLANEGAAEMAMHDIVKTACHNQESLVELIQYYIELSVTELNKMKNDARQLAVELFNSDKNYSNFITKVLK